MTKTRSRKATNSPAVRAATPAGNQAAHMGVRIQEATAAPGADYWKAVNVRHLPPEENRGKHHIYVDAIDEGGQRVRNPELRIAYTWEGRRDDEAAPPKPLDKPDNEPAGNLDVYKGQIITAWLQGDGLPSDRVIGLHTDHEDQPAADGGNGNTRFHHSFHLTFQRAKKAATPVVVGGGESKPEPAPRPTQPGVLVPEQWAGVVTATQLNLRLGPGTEHVQIGSLFQGDPVTVTGRVGDWLSVLAGGQQGFVHTHYVQRAEPSAGATLYPPPADQQITLPSNADPTKRAVAAAWNNYGALLVQHAAELGIDPGIAVAVLVAESRGEPFAADGRMVIRFENHIFYHYWGKENEARFRQHFTFDATTSHQGHQWRADPNGPWQPCHTSQAVEWQVFAFASRLDERAAMYAISMGAPQIMGFNHRAIGYETVQQMFHAFQSDVRNQIASLFRFMAVNGLVDVVRRGDYVAFARVYNGPGQAEAYARLIRDYQAAFESVRGPAVARALAAAEEAIPRMPMPPSPIPGKTLAEADPQIYEAWRNHIIQGFENNQILFRRTLNGFLHPYWITVIMYGLLFGVGLISFIVAIVLAVRPDSGVGPTAIFGGLSVVAFLTFFLSRPLQALEENLQFITWLGIVYNTYWTRLVYLQDLNTVQDGLSDASDDAVEHLKALIDKHGERSQNRPNFPGVGGG